MKLFFAVSVLLLSAVLAHVQAQDKTIILVRHAEKAAAVDAMTGAADPPLSDEGRVRADRLKKVAGRYRPGAIYSTAYRRTRETAEPIAKHRGKEIQTYDAQKQAELVDKMLKSKTKRFVVVGHSNTIPPLANLLAKKELFRNLLDNEYGVFYVIRLKNGVFRKLEVYPY